MAALLLAVTGCAPADAPAAEAPTTPQGWTMVPPTAWRLSGQLAHPRLAEASGVAMTAQRPGSFWTLNDSGNSPELYLVDTTGALLTTLPITGAPNVDWEEVALGPCPTGRCLYIADTGDNLERRAEVAIHRLVEPRITGALPATLSARPVETLRLRYPDGPHDVEAMAVTANGTILLVSKGRSGGVLLFRVRATAWTTGSATADRVDSLPIVANGGNGRLVTGMALSPDGRRVMVRTYRDLFPFELGGDDRLTPLGKPTACDILGREPQGEGVDWLDRERLVLTSERGLMKVGTVHIARCSYGNP